MPYDYNTEYKTKILGTACNDLALTCIWSNVLTVVGAISGKSPYTTKFIYCRMIIRQRGQARIRERGSAGINSGTRPRGNNASLSLHMRVYIKN